VADWELFRDLPEAELRRLLAVARRRRFERREVVFHRGDPADTLHLVSSGRFAVRVTTRLGDTATIGVHGPGEAFGELALVDPGSPRSTTVAALERGETFAVHRDDFRRLRREHPSVDAVLVQVLGTRLRRASDLLVEALYMPAETRVLRRIRELTELYASDVVPLTQEDVAGLAGTSRATVNRVLRAESKRGTVDLRRGRIVIRDPDALASRAASSVA
jgi:CRP/FNR family cyclic AMP-dependent transcriptional regulator